MSDSAFSFVDLGLTPDVEVIERSVTRLAQTLVAHPNDERAGVSVTRFTRELSAILLNRMTRGDLTDVRRIERSLHDVGAHLPLASQAERLHPLDRFAASTSVLDQMLVVYLTEANPTRLAGVVSGPRRRKWRQILTTMARDQRGMRAHDFSPEPYEDSKHAAAALGRLAREGLVHRRKDDNSVFYKLSTDGWMVVRHMGLESPAFVQTVFEPRDRELVGYDDEKTAANTEKLNQLLRQSA